MQSSRGHEYGVIHLLTEESGLLVEVLAKNLAIPESDIENLLNFGAIYLTNQRTTHNVQLKKQDYIRVHTKPRRFQRAVNWENHILWQNENYIIINKPSGLPCHPTVDNLFENILTQLECFLGQKIFLTHRLDLPTTGLLVFAKTLNAQASFNKALANSEVSKIYEAVIEGQQAPALGTLTHHMEISPRAPKIVHAEKQENTVLCQLEILETKSVGDNTWVKIKLETGRTHQIRAQLSKIGFPIIGDIQYGAKTIKKIGWEEIELKSAEIVWPPYSWVLSQLVQ